MAHELAFLIPFLVPCIRIAAIVGDACRHYTLVENTVLQFLEEAVDACLAVAEVIDGEPLFSHHAEELLADAHHALEGLLANIPQLSLILVEEVLAAHQLPQLLAVLLVEVAEDGESELLDLSYDVPCAVVADVVHDVLHQPLQQQVGGRQRVDELVDGYFLHLFVVQLHTQVGGEVQLACQVAHHTLEERVDGLHAEVAVVVQQQVQRYPCSLGYLWLRQRLAQSFIHLVQVAFRVRIVAPDAVEVGEDAHLHLLRSFVGEGNSKYLPVVLRIAHQ